MKICQGERGSNVTHSINSNREDEDYPTGVSVEMCPLSILVLNPGCYCNPLRDN